MTKREYIDDDLVARITEMGFTGSTSGHGTDMIMLNIEPNRRGREAWERNQGIRPCDYQFLRKAVSFLAYYIGNESYDDHIRSPYDCTGLAFGSRWERVAVEVHDEDVAVILLHHYAVDI